MPWTASDALGHTKKATSAASRRQWSHIANSVLNRGGSDASAIRQANAVIRNRFSGSSDSAEKPSPKRLGPQKGIGGRSRTSSPVPTEESEKRQKKSMKRPNAKRLFRTDVDRRSMKVRMRGR